MIRTFGAMTGLSNQPAGLDVGLPSGLTNFFGDGSDGAFNPATILSTGTTAPNGGTVANLWDMNAGTSFTTGSLPSGANNVAFQTDFGAPTLISNFQLYNAQSTAGGDRVCALQSSTDGSSWTQRGTATVSGGAAGNVSFNGANTIARYWRLATTATGGPGAVTCQGSTINYISGDTQTSQVWRIMYPVTIHSGICIKQFSSLTLPAGYEITTDNPCRGLIIYCTGSVSNPGAISMTSKAGFGNDNISPLILSKVKSDLTTKTIQKYFQLTTVFEALKGGAGGNGGAGGAGIFSAGAGGAGGNGRINSGGYGGGGGGGGGGSAAGGQGGAISFAELGGGIGGKQGSSSTPTPSKGCLGGGGGGAGSTPSASSGGDGGNATNCGVGAGGGGGGGSVNGSTAASPSGFAGGLILVICKGNVTNSGTISANGTQGGDGAVSGGAQSGGGGGGGGTGGGVVGIFYGGTYSNTGSITVSGGGAGNAGAANGGNAGLPGTSGSVGTIVTQKIA
ncbi:discoidin domain-containing protein [Cohnella silvisoli]|uniref:Discoidin domain-containing protein n=1 Tax=Cohnella silvisoli TaxID=2873699 RepID=A0ABV1KMH8_9BACL|nr:discoidin domain-containing protein [Cohnella silvisoli]MCD9020513.1 discoidin domain-containing protein [Cohnella silvisoli]